MANMATHHMASMELTDEEQLDAVTPLPMDKPKFPCGLRISLTKPEFDKLGIDPASAEVGAMVHLFAMARITSVTLNDDDQNNCRVEMQIEDLELESEDDEEG